jgi:23S rRNA (cytosine1962-C5)-methyltransferase
MMNVSIPDPIVQTDIPILKLNPKAHNRVRNGHPWIFRDELAAHQSIDAGSIIRVETDYGYDLGLGFYHPSSQIAVRLLRWQEKQVDTHFFISRLQSALALRQRLFPAEPVYRLCFGESDYLPGLVIDRYGDYCAVQLLSAGMDILRPMIFEAMLAIMPDLKGIILKNDSQLRMKEGLQPGEEIVWGNIPEEIPIIENGIKLSLSLLKGQKTGYFLDQRLNRAFVGSLAKGLTVLDCFTNQGGFALNAAAGGAIKAVGIDSAASAVQACRNNAELNGFDQCSFVQADVFDYLKDQAAAGNKWDMVILDPPAFAKSKGSVAQARRGYSEINRQALKLISTGGYLISASCSHHVSEEMLLECISAEAKRINRQLRLLWRGGQSPCHPVLLTMPETRYLKCLIFEVQ